MYVINITDSYDNFTNICTNNEKSTDLIIRTLLLTILCRISVLCLMSLMVYTIKKPFH